MTIEETARSTQEQAVAAWIDHLNQLRVDELITKLAAQDTNLESALEALENLKLSVFSDVINNGKGRGGPFGMHGFISERLQVALENARKLIIGAKPEYFLVDDNGMVDYLRGDTPIQAKFVQMNLGLGAIKDHLTNYPDFLKNGGIYQIPKDYYETLRKVLSISPEEGAKLSRNSDPSIILWKYAHQFFKETGIDPNKIEPAVVNYRDVQKATYENTVSKEEESLRETDKTRRDHAYEQSQPTWQEGLKTTAAGAAIEGGMSFCLGVATQLRSGKKLHEFTEQEWKDVGLDTAKGTGKGAIRGAAIYGLTNFTATPAAVASAMVTAAFGIAAQANQLRQENLSEAEFIANSEVVCLDVSVSAISSLMGQVLIPVPMLGAMVGNAAGMFMYGIAKENLSKREQMLIAGFIESTQKLNEQLDAHDKELVEMLEREFGEFQTVMALAFDPDVNIAFEGSIKLAQYVGCKDEHILKDKEAIDAFFL